MLSYDSYQPPLINRVTSVPFFPSFAALMLNRRPGVETYCELTTDLSSRFRWTLAVREAFQKPNIFKGHAGARRITCEAGPEDSTYLASYA